MIHLPFHLSINIFVCHWWQKKSLDAYLNIIAYIPLEETAHLLYKKQQNLPVNDGKQYSLPHNSIPCLQAEAIRDSHLQWQTMKSYHWGNLQKLSFLPHIDDTCPLTASLRCRVKAWLQELLWIQYLRSLLNTVPSASLLLFIPAAEFPQFDFFQKNSSRGLELFCCPLHSCFSPSVPVQHVPSLLVMKPISVA